MERLVGLPGSIDQLVPVKEHETNTGTSRTAPPQGVPDTNAGLGPTHTVSPHAAPETDVGPSHISVPSQEAKESEADPDLPSPSHMRVKKPALKSTKAKIYKRKGKKQSDDVPSKGEPADLPPFEEVLDTPPIARALFDTPVSVRSDSVLVAAAPPATIVSLIWRIKRLPRMRKVPVKFSDYSHSMVHSSYVLNEQEEFLVRGFNEYYSTKGDELASICTMVSSNDLKKALEEGTWLDTNLMYFYFEILRDGCPTAFVSDPSISSWWQDGSDASIKAAFGKHGHRVWEARECRTLVFVLHYRNHFTLVVGYVDERRWEFYNSLAGDRLTRSKAEQFIGWLNAMYMHFGWTDPFLWPIVIKEDIPHQDNGNDCGVFAVAFAEHCVHRRPITFTQSDIPYFRSRIVIELFKRSWQVNANRLNLPELLNLPI